MAVRKVGLVITSAAILRDLHATPYDSVMHGTNKLRNVILLRFQVVQTVRA